LLVSSQSVWISTLTGTAYFCKITRREGVYFSLFPFFLPSFLPCLLSFVHYFTPFLLFVYLFSPGKTEDLSSMRITFLGPSG